ncbi:hypothetical protein SBBP2_20058 [Burkholderiales bacterium]|nr:hypothetical protein SBBP2_20058 [Burkholderiales bacterium]
MQPSSAEASKCPAPGKQRAFRVGNDGHTVGQDAAGGLRAGILFMQMALLSWTKVDVDLAGTIYLVTALQSLSYSLSAQTLYSVPLLPPSSAD